MGRLSFSGAYRPSKATRLPPLNEYNEIGTILGQGKKRAFDDGTTITSVLPSEYLRMPLLSKQEELDLGRRHKLHLVVKNEIKRMMQKHGEDNVTLGMVAALFNTTENDLRLIRHNGENAGELLVQSNMRLVLHIAKAYEWRGATAHSLVMAGVSGLYRALEKYDAEKGFRFSTYASWWIKQACGRVVAEQGRPIQVPMHVHDMLTTLSLVRDKLEQRLFREPDSYELSQAMAMPQHKVEMLMDLADQEFISDNALVYRPTDEDDKIVKVRDIIPEDGPDLEERFQAEYREEVLKEKMGSVLGTRELQVLGHRFGLFGNELMTLEDVGKKFGLTRERARQIESQALERLRANKHLFEGMQENLAFEPPKDDDEAGDAKAKPKKSKPRRGNPRNAPRVRKKRKIVDEVDGAASGGDTDSGEKKSSGSVKASLEGIDLSDKVEKGGDLSDTDPEIQELLEQFSATNAKS